MILYLIKVNDVYYGKKDNINGRIIDPRYIPDKNDLYYIVKEGGYKTKSAAIKAAQQLQKEKTTAKISLQALTFTE